FTSASTTTVMVNSGVATFSNVAFLAGGTYTVSASGTGGLSGQGVTIHVARIGPPPSWLLSVASNLTHSSEYYTGIVTAAYRRSRAGFPRPTSPTVLRPAPSVNVNVSPPIIFSTWAAVPTPPRSTVGSAPLRAARAPTKTSWPALLAQPNFSCAISATPPIGL